MIGNDNLEEQREIASQADRRRLEFVEKEAELAQEHSRDLTEDAIDSTYSRLKCVGHMYACLDNGCATLAVYMCVC